VSQRVKALVRFAAGIFRYRSLVLNMVLVTLITGLVGGLLVNLVVGRLVRDAFQERLMSELEQDALKGRTAFDEFAKLHFELTKVITEQHRFVRFVETAYQQGVFQRLAPPLRHKRQPAWLPRRSTLRRFAKAGMYILLNGRAEAIEYFYRGATAPPPQLLKPEPSLLLAARNENFMTFFDGIPFVVSSAPVLLDDEPLGTLLLATAINDELLASIRTSDSTTETVALTSGYDSAIIATSNHALVPRGGVLEDYKDRYFIFNAPIFNYEYTDLLVSYAHFVDRATVDRLANPIVRRERLYQTLAALVLVSAFGIISFRFTRRVQRVTNQVNGFSRDALGVNAPIHEQGDQLAGLEALLHWLAREVAAANREQAALRRAILEAIPMPLFYTDSEGLVLGCNRAFETFMGQSRANLTGALEPRVFNALDSDEMSVELELNDASGVPHVFLISRAPFENRDDNAAGWVVTMADITENRRAADQIRAFNHELEERVIARTAELQASLDDLHLAQDRLVEAEKMASLGELVAGVAHEINTPVGIGVTAASHLQDAAAAIAEQMPHGLRRSQLERFIRTASLSSATILSNLQRASDLIRGFKDVAVDRSSEQRRRFGLCPYLEEILRSLGPKIKHTPYRVELHCAGQIEMDSYPGALAQVISNLFMNAVIHGFDEREQGVFDIRAEQHGDEVVLQVRDDGRGMNREEATRIFDPFYTTKRGSGGSGLGMHIVYNQITHTLGGGVVVHSEPGVGTHFMIRLPRTVAGGDKRSMGGV
jgi:PAS domain S-box-containing protein